MAVKHKGHFGIGVILGLSFLVTLVLIFSPIFPKAPDGKPQNGLEYADEMFNKLSKGSSYFIPKLTESNKEFAGKMFSVSIKMDSPEDAKKVAKLFTAAGAKVDIKDSELKIEGNLGKTLEAVLKDADAMYYNEGAKVSGMYGYDEKEVLKNWWAALGKIDKEFKKEKKIRESEIVSDVSKKAVETAYNYYGIAPESVKERAGLMSGLLVFYIVYTMWWGFAIFYLFEGLGLSMKKAKVRKEV
ncbi:MAG: hypothetical protein ABH874_01090 [Methanobacteriota archaeon]